MKRNVLARTLSGLLLWFDNLGPTSDFAGSDSCVSLEGGLLGFVQRMGLLVVGLVFNSRAVHGFFFFLALLWAFLYHEVKL